MPRTSYSLPFRPKEIIEGRQHPREGDLDRSITAFLSLLLRTAPGEVPGDPDFGCRFWDRIAEAMKGEIWLSQMSDDVRTAVKAHEHRLQDVTVDITPTRADRQDLTLQIQGRIIASRKPYRFERVIRTDPIRITS